MSATIGAPHIASMSQADAAVIADWRYQGPYAFYDWRADANDLAELIAPELRGDRYFSAHDENGELVGFFSFQLAGEVLVVGLGLRPDLTGRGLGFGYLEGGLAYARDRYEPRRFRLSVASFNSRAISVYERAGFLVTRSYEHETNGGVFPFVEMEREA